MNKSENGKSSIMSPIDVKYLALAYPPKKEEQQPEPDPISETLIPDAEITVTIRRYGKTYQIVDSEKLAEFFK